MGINGGGRIVGNPLHDMRRIVVPIKRPDLPGFLHINKCGTTTMSQALREKHAMESFSKERYPARPIVAMWRDPFSRAESAYRMFVSCDAELPPWPEYIDGLLDRYERKEEKDVHKLPMYEVASDRYGVFVPTIIVRWDWVRMAELFELDPLPVKNASVSCPTVWSPEQKNRYRELYAKDFEIWEG